MYFIQVPGVKIDKENNLESYCSNLNHIIISNLKRMNINALFSILTIEKNICLTFPLKNAFQFYFWHNYVTYITMTLN